MNKNSTEGVAVQGWRLDEWTRRIWWPRWLSFDLFALTQVELFCTLSLPSKIRTLVCIVWQKSAFFLPSVFFCFVFVCCCCCWCLGWERRQSDFIQPKSVWWGDNLFIYLFNIGLSKTRQSRAIQPVHSNQDHTFKSSIHIQDIQTEVPENNILPERKKKKKKVRKSCCRGVDSGGCTGAVWLSGRHRAVCNTIMSLVF